MLMEFSKTERCMRGFLEMMKSSRNYEGGEFKFLKNVLNYCISNLVGLTPLLRSLISKACPKESSELLLIISLFQYNYPEMVARKVINLGIVLTLNPTSSFTMYFNRDVVAKSVRKFMLEQEGEPLKLKA
ncbi:Uncharacterized protein Fot_54734 [Forsythia ovata]|uniref:Uncharacterized protein n=1 Tax=Forsythia ovata TaxID=205694 RepID=A0ABD1P6I5_9LAMI